ncbi:MAG: alkaline shock response membrane anchor protein AmaP [Candidatus Omnitrophica bacterium]|nr:alkaline shock response membrane anchor protein AmaP [Candidatus Omnitrophota bacterium]
MRIFTVLGIIFYAAITITIGIALIAFSLNLLQPQNINDFLAYVRAYPNSRIIVGLLGLLFILVSFSFAQLILGRFQREKTIAFMTSSGQVTIALSAVEDLIRRISHHMPEIKELRPDVIATKKGIMADLRVVLRSESNIPELTARLQDLTRTKIQEVLGIEEEIVIKIHVAKIISAEEKEKKRKEAERLEQPTVPFSGYGRV